MAKVYQQKNCFMLKFVWNVCNFFYHLWGGGGEETWIPVVGTGPQSLNYLYFSVFIPNGNKYRIEYSNSIIKKVRTWTTIQILNPKPTSASYPPLNSSGFFFGEGVGCGDWLPSTLPARSINTHCWTQLKKFISLQDWTNLSAYLFHFDMKC